MDVDRLSMISTLYKSSKILSFNYLGAYSLIHRYYYDYNYILIKSI